MSSKPSVRSVSRMLQYNPETGKLSWKIRRGSTKAGSPAGTITTDGRRQVWLLRKRYPATHLIWVLMKGSWPPKGMQVDHKNRQPDDNRWSNLRLATHTQNSFNRLGRSKTGYKGVCRVRSGKYEAVIYAHGVRYYLGTFSNKFIAHCAYRVAARELHKQFARFE